MCSICDWKDPISEYKHFSIFEVDNTLYARWFQHRTVENINLCHCIFPKAMRTLKIKAREKFGHNKIYIEKHEEEGHLHWKAVQLNEKNEAIN